MQLNDTLFIDAPAMSTVHPIDEKQLTEVGQDGTEQETPPCPERRHIEQKDRIMNSKILYIATLALSLASTLALADQDAPLTRAQVQAQARQAAADGTLHAAEYYLRFYGDTPTQSNLTRAQVQAQAQQAEADGTLHAAEYYLRFYGNAPTQSEVTRAQVQAQAQQAAADGTLHVADYYLRFYGNAPTQSNLTRAQVESELVGARDEHLPSPIAEANYRPFETVPSDSTLTRSEVKKEVLVAAANGTLEVTEFNDAASKARLAQQHVAGNRLAQRLAKKATHSDN